MQSFCNLRLILLLAAARVVKVKHPIFSGEKNEDRIKVTRLHKDEVKLTLTWFEFGLVMLVSFLICCMSPGKPCLPKKK